MVIQEYLLTEMWMVGFKYSWYKTEVVVQDGDSGLWHILYWE